MRGRRAEKTQPAITVKNEVCPQDQLEAHTLSEGSRCKHRRPPRAPRLEWGSGRKRPPCISSQAPLTGPPLLPSLCCDTCVLPHGGEFTALPLFSSLLSLFSFQSLRLSGLLSAKLGSTASHKHFPCNQRAVLAPSSSFQSCDNWVPAVTGDFPCC